MPNSCIPTRYSDFVIIKAINPSDIKWNYPFNALAAQSKTIRTNTHFNILSSQNTVVINVDSSTTKLTTTPKTTTAGLIYTCVLEFVLEYVEDTMDAVNDIIADLQTPKHIFLSTINGAQSALRLCDNVGYRFTHHEEDGEIKCSITIANLAGLQRITE